MMSVLIVILVIDTMINNVVDFISKQLVSNLGILLFSIITAVSAAGQYLILSYVKQKSKEIIAKSVSLQIIHTVVTIVQYSLTAMIVFIILDILLTGRYHGVVLIIVTATSYALNIALLAFLGQRFFSWYKSNRNSVVVLLYGFSSVVIAMTSTIAVLSDSYNLLSKQGEITPSSDVVFPSFEPGTMTTMFHEIYNYSDLAAFILIWTSTTLLLRHYFRKMRKIKFWILTAIPLIYYLSSYVEFFNLYVPSSDSEQFYYYLYSSLITTAGGFLFAIAFRYVAKGVSYNRTLREYMIISAYGFILLFISPQATLTAASYPPFGIATVSFMGLSSYLVLVGIYSAAVSISQDLRLRDSIKKSALEESKLLFGIGSVQMEQKVQSKVVKRARRDAYNMMRYTGIQTSLTENDIKQEVSAVLKELKILQNITEISNKEKEILQGSIKFMSCLRFAGIRLAYDNYFELYENILSKYRSGAHKGVRFVTSISDKNSAELIRRFLNIGIQIKHVKNMPPIDFSVSNKEMIATIQEIENGDKDGDGQASSIMQNLLVSNEPLYIRHFTSIFEELWKNGLDAADRIKDIEDGVDSEGIEVIHNPAEVKKIGLDLIKSAVTEISVIFGTASAFREENYSGTMELLRAAVDRNVKVRILTPLDYSSEKTIEEAKIQEPQQQLQPIEVRYIEPDLQTKVTILIVDRKFTLAIELKESPQDIIGLTTYSNSKPTVISYVSIFESLWKQSELYDQLKVYARLQKDFIDIAAHELRTPITPILVMASAIQDDIDKTNDTEQDDIRIKRQDFEIIFRNARRLKQLTEDILDVARIESETLKIEPERFDINAEIFKIVQEYNTSLNENKSGLKRDVKLYCQQPSEDILIQADKGRVNQVISNLLNNAIKFTDKGSITITTEKKEQHVMIGVKDTGIGIDPEILPRLFTKFATKSRKGTGLGLFISKSIVEAHGGRIWVDNSYIGGTAIYFLLSIN